MHDMRQVSQNNNKKISDYLTRVPGIQADTLIKLFKLKLKVFLNTF